MNMRQRSRKLLLLVFVVAFSFPLVHGQVTYSPTTFTFQDHIYAYYQVDSIRRSDWVVVFLPGGLGGNGVLLGCGGNIFKFEDPTSGRMHEVCWAIASKDSWLAGEFMLVDFDFIEPLVYQFSFGTRDWIITLLHHLKDDLGYPHILLAGFSAGAAVTASIIAWQGEEMNWLIDAAAIYEGPTLLSGALGSARIAYNVTVKTFLVYGSEDQPIAPDMPGAPLGNGINYADNMNPNVPHQLIIVPKGHDPTVIVDTLPDLITFLLP